MKKFSIPFTILLLSCMCSFAQKRPHVRPSAHEKDSLRNELEGILANDQKYRWMLMYGELDEQRIAEFKKMDETAKWKRMKDVQKNKVGITQAQKDSIGKFQDQIDAENFVTLSGIIAHYGFPRKYIEEYKVTTILMHASSNLVNADFLKMLKEEVLLGNLSAIEYARLYDRIQYGLHLPELYFVNERFDEATGTSVPEQPLNIDETNKARQEIGLKKFKAL